MSDLTKNSTIPLVVDLDGTLIKSDILLENFYATIRQNPLVLFLIPLWLFKGKVYLKNKLSEKTLINIKALPYNEAFLEYLRQEFKGGRTLVLATASVHKFAQEIATHLGIFNKVLGTDNKTNLKGKNKLNALLALYGEKKFDYAGDGQADLHIFPHAREAIIVNASARVLKEAKKTSSVKKIFEAQPVNLKTYIKTIRTYQWVKNILLVVPLVMSHQWGDIMAIVYVWTGFVSFSFCASAGYLFNDLLDLPSDRAHPRKKERPLASGRIPILDGSLLFITLLLTGLALALVINWNFFLLLMFYCLISLSYTFLFKSYVLIDVLVLAGLYTLRVVAGGVLADVRLSFWLLAFSIFIFFSLALVKRCSELVSLSKANVQYAGGKDYSVSDMDYLREMGIASGYLAVLIVAFYINSPDVKALYSHPEALWLVCPALLYWISRVWLKTGRGEMTDDPIVFSIKDRGSRIVALGIVIIILLAI